MSLSQCSVNQSHLSSYCGAHPDCSLRIICWWASVSAGAAKALHYKNPSCSSQDMTSYKRLQIPLDLVFVCFEFSGSVRLWWLILEYLSVFFNINFGLLTSKLRWVAISHLFSHNKFCWRCKIYGENGYSDFNFFTVIHKQFSSPIPS